MPFLEISENCHVYWILVETYIIFSGFDHILASTKNLGSSLIVETVEIYHESQTWHNPNLHISTIC